MVASVKMNQPNSVFLLLVVSLVVPLVVPSQALYLDTFLSPIRWLVNAFPLPSTLESPSAATDTNQSANGHTLPVHVHPFVGEERASHSDDGGHSGLQHRSGAALDLPSYDSPHIEKLGSDILVSVPFFDNSSALSLIQFLIPAELIEVAGDVLKQKGYPPNSTFVLNPLTSLQKPNGTPNVPGVPVTASSSNITTSAKGSFTVVRNKGQPQNKASPQEDDDSTTESVTIQMSTEMAVPFRPRPVLHRVNEYTNFTEDELSPREADARGTHMTQEADYDIAVNVTDDTASSDDALSKQKSNSETIPIFTLEDLFRSPDNVPATVRLSDDGEIYEVDSD